MNVDYEAIKARIEREQERARNAGFEWLGHLHASQLQYGDQVFLPNEGPVTVRRTEPGIGEEVIVIAQGTGKRYVLRDFGSSLHLHNDVWRPLTSTTSTNA